MAASDPLAHAGDVPFRMPSPVEIRRRGDRVRQREQVTLAVLLLVALLVLALAVAGFLRTQGGT